MCPLLIFYVKTHTRFGQNPHEVKTHTGKSPTRRFSVEAHTLERGAIHFPLLERFEPIGVTFDREPHLAELEHCPLEGTAEFGSMCACLCLDDLPLRFGKAYKDTGGRCAPVGAVLGFFPFLELAVSLLRD